MTMKKNFENYYYNQLARGMRRNSREQPLIFLRISIRHKFRSQLRVTSRSSALFNNIRRLASDLAREK